jgi:xanthine dehydrogenase accessory factor
MADTNDDVLNQAADWLASGKDVALATVIGTWGSSPRPVGSQLAVADDGAFVGSVSGGCIEGAVIGEGLTAILDGKVRVLDFGVTNEQAWEVGLACGGDIKILVEKAGSHRDVSRLASERPLATVTNIQTGERNIVTSWGSEGAIDLSKDMLSTVRKSLRDDRSRMYEQGGQSLFVQVFNPPLRMLIVGAVHISQALVPMAQIAGFGVTIVDPRGSFATDARFPNVTLIDEWPDDALEALTPDARTAIVTLTHDPKLDDPALEIALKSDAFYIGSLGSKRTHASRLDRLAELGFNSEDVARINGPIGLDLGATSPTEIAVAILGEVIAAKHGKLETVAS